MSATRVSMVAWRQMHVRLGRPRATPAWVLLLALGCGGHRLTAKHDASPDATLQPFRPDVEDAPGDVALGAPSPDAAPNQEVFRLGETASGDVPALADRAQGDGTADRAQIDMATFRDATPVDRQAGIDTPSGSDLDAPSAPDSPSDLTLPLDGGGSDLLPWTPADPATLCVRTGGKLSTTRCQCPETDFADDCTSRAGFYCQAGSCNTGVYIVRICACPEGRCFRSAYGCSGAGCTVDMDCNDDPALGENRGQCIAGSCICQGSTFNPDTGKCL
jgi:hypothetical protein